MTVNVVGTPPAIGSSSQFTAVAIRSDNTTSTVTSQATWRSTNESVATVSPAGLVTGVGGGAVEIDATYTGVIGSLTFTVVQGATIVISGTVTAQSTGRPVESATIAIGGPAARSTATDALGRYSLSGIPAGLGAITVSAAASGYLSQTRSVSVFTANVVQDFSMPSGTPCPALGFDDLTQSFAPVATSSMCGLTLTPTMANWIAYTVGRPAPSIVFNSPSTGSATGEVMISAGGTPFRLQSVDIYSSTTQIPYVLTGIRNSSVVFDVQGTQGNTFGNFVTVQNPNAATVIDALIIRMTNPCCSNPMGLDNIRVSF